MSISSKLVIVLPLVVLLTAIVISQTYITNGLPGRFSSIGRAAIAEPDAPELQLMGYNYNRQLLMLSLTLYNAGSTQLTILNLTYDGHALARGEIGGRLPQYSGGTNSSGSLCLVPTSNDLIFPQSNYWNIDTGGLCTPTIIPSGYAQLFIGVSPTSQTEHTLQVWTQQGTFNFALRDNSSQ